MPREFSRAARVADQLQRDLSELIRLGLKDPRIGMVTITAVDIIRDLRSLDLDFAEQGGVDRCHKR